MDEEGIIDLNDHLKKNQEHLEQCIQSILITAMNYESIRLFRTGPDSEVIRVHIMKFLKKNPDLFRELIMSLSKGESVIEHIIRFISPDGKDHTMVIRLAVDPVCQDDLSRVFVSFMEINLNTCC